MRDLNELFAALARSRFRRRFRLNAAERAHLHEKGLETILQHAQRFIAERLAPAQPRNDGRQTPMRGHPVFVAQHATATCCRSCLAKWHGIPVARSLSGVEQSHILAVLSRWLEGQFGGSNSPSEWVKQGGMQRLLPLFDAEEGDLA
jgi:hypothetical protein